MLNIKFEGYYLDNGLSKKIRVAMNPSNDYVLSELSKLNDKCEGTIIMENKLAKEDIEPLNLTLFFEKGSYLLMLLDYDDEGYPNIRTAFNPEAPKGEWGYIDGENYDATTIINDLEIVKKCFLEFNATGDVSKQLLS